MKTIRLILALAFVTVTAYCFLNLGLLGKAEPVKKGELSSGWTVEFKGEVLKDIDLKEYKAMKTKKGDIMILTNVLPDFGIPYASMVIDNYLSEVDVYVDGELIYVSGKEQYENDKLIGYGVHIVDIPVGYEGKEIKIVHKAGANNSIGALTAPLFLKKGDVTRELLRDSFAAAAIAISDMLIGISMIGIAVVHIPGNKSFLQMLYIGFFSFFIGLWAFCDHDIILLLNNNYQMKTVSEYVALYLAPIFVFSYYWSKIKHEASQLVKSIFRMMFIAYAGLTMVTLLLHVFNIVHLTSMLQVQHTLMLMIIAFILTNFFISLKRKENNIASFYIGVVVLSVFGISDIIYFNLLAYSKNLNGSFDGISFLGTGILVISMVMDFSDEMSSKVRMASEVELYEQMANSDYLTGLANRRQCELVFDEIDQEDSDYAVIAFDLNNLKQVNDSHGHAAGDKLLKDFANVLKGVFESVGTVGRTGGDEFIVIIRHADILNLEQLLAKLDDKIEEANKRKREYKISAARGVCTRLDNRKNVRSAYRMADQRMYENKIRMKAEVKGTQS